MSIVVQQVSKSWGAFRALKDVSLTVNSGELVALLGPSGSGKTTLLRIIAGLETPDAGAVHLDGEDATNQDVRTRQVGFVFQHYALFRHMSVFENVAFGLRVRPRKDRPSDAEIEKKVLELLGLVQLEGLAQRMPTQLSGGQRQRVALARALCVRPRVLLLDEPFGALDSKVRKELRAWLRRLHDELHVTSVFVTHDQEEALEVADRICVMNHGRIVQVGPPAEVYEQPASPFVAEFLGDVNVFHGREGMLSYVRPHDLLIVREPSAEASLGATVEHVQAVGPSVRVRLHLEGGAQSVDAVLTAAEQRGLNLSKGDRVYLKASRAQDFEAGMVEQGAGI